MHPYNGNFNAIIKNHVEEYLLTEEKCQLTKQNIQNALDVEIN